MQWEIAAITAVQAGSPASGPAQTSVAQSEAAPNVFRDLMQRHLDEINTSVGTAETALRELAAGKPVELHDVMISLERARISVQTFVQVRNGLIESYQDLMRMQL